MIDSPTLDFLLIGDAAGLILPITFEWIGSVFKSGILAADAIIEHFDNGARATSIYLKALGPILDVILRRCIIQSDLKTAPRGDSGLLAESLADAYRETLPLQES